MEMHKISIKFKSVLTFSRACTSSTRTRHTEQHLVKVLQNEGENTEGDTSPLRPPSCWERIQDLTPHQASASHVGDGGAGLQTCLGGHMNPSN